jgi:hypothetical protein
MCVGGVGLHAVQTRHKNDPDSMPRAGRVAQRQEILEQLIVENKVLLSTLPIGAQPVSLIT